MSNKEVLTRWVLENWIPLAFEVNNGVYTYVGNSRLKNLLIARCSSELPDLVNDNGLGIRCIINDLSKVGELQKMITIELRKGPPAPAPPSPPPPPPPKPVQASTVPRGSSLPRPSGYSTSSDSGVSLSYITATDKAAETGKEDPPTRTPQRFKIHSSSLREMPPSLHVQRALLHMDENEVQSETGVGDRELEDAILFTADMFKESRKNRILEVIGAQYALLGNDIQILSQNQSAPSADNDGRMFLNTKIPASFFICGVQGSGKSHTLSCILENYMIPSRTLGGLEKPLSAMVFHFGQFSSKQAFRPCEAAYLACLDTAFLHEPGVRSVTVLVSRSNFHSLNAAYSEIPGVTVRPLLLQPKDLTISTILTLMSVDKSSMTRLYMYHVTKLLRDMASESAGEFDYDSFRARIEQIELEPLQKRMLHQRLDLLESFLDLKSVEPIDFGKRDGELTIVDLTCPFVDEASACVLFNICIGLYLAGSKAGGGKVIAMDEAHKYMTDTPASKVLTEQLLGVIRQHRHYGARVIIATQEPTISPRLMDLVSATIIHRFSSPDWFSTLRNHISVFRKSGVDDSNLFARITALKVGQAMVFAPTALVANRKEDHWDGGRGEPVKLGMELLLMKMRRRLTMDGGKSIVCV